MVVLVGPTAMFWMLWGCRNDIIFERKIISNPMTMIKIMCSWIVDWSVLQIKRLQQRVLKLRRVRFIEQHKAGDLEFFELVANHGPEA